MKQFYILVAAILFSGFGFGQISVTTLPQTDTNDFSTYNGDAISTPTGWSVSPIDYEGIGSGTGTGGGFYAYHPSSNPTEKSFGVLRSGSSTFFFAVEFVNNTGSAITGLDISFNYEQYRYVNTSNLDLVGTGALSGNVSIDSEDFVGSATGVNGVVSNERTVTLNLTGLNIPNGSNYGLQWTLLNESGADNGLAVDDFSITANGAPAGPEVSFDAATSTENETNTTFNTSIPITMTNYDSPVTISVAVNGSGTAEAEDYTLNTTSLTFSANETLNVSLDINDDADFDDETLLLDIAVTSGTATLGVSQHTVTILDDEVPPPATIIAVQDFDGATPNWSYANAVAFFDNGWGGGFYGIRDITNSSPLNQANLSANILAENDMDDTPDGTTGFAETTFSNVDVSRFTDVTLSFDWDVVGYNANNDDAKYELFYDGVSQGDVFLLDGNNATESDEGTVTINIPNAVDSVSLIVAVRNNGQSGYSGFDNFKIEGTYNGLTYAGGTWTPNPPDNTTGASDALILDGVYTLSSDVNLNNLTVDPGAGLQVATATTLTVSSLTLESKRTSYSSFILDGSINGTITYNRSVNSYTDDDTANDNDLISPPLTQVSGEFFPAFAATNSNLFASGNARFFGPFNRDTGLYENYDLIANLNTSLTTATGYRTATTDGGTLSFIGNAESGNISKDITVGSDATFGLWNLIGNPYPSYINAETFLTHTLSTTLTGETNMDLFANASGIYGYDGDASNGWIVITQANAVGQLIAPGQGFFVAADSDKVVTHDVEFTSAMRTTGSSDDFIANRTSNPLTFLKLKASTVNKNYFTEFYFNTNASQGLDHGYDAVVWGANTPSFALYSHLVADNTGLPIALQALSSADIDNITIPLGLNAGAGEPLTISINEKHIPETVNVYLEDYENNTITLLNDAEFRITPMNPLMGTGRFFLRFSNSTLTTDDNTLNTLNIYTNKLDKTVVIEGQLSEQITASIYDLQGRLVNTSILDISKNNQTIQVGHLSTGVYVVQLETSKTSISQKVILH